MDKPPKKLVVGLSKNPQSALPAFDGVLSSIVMCVAR